MTTARLSRCFAAALALAVVAPAQAKRPDKAQEKKGEKSFEGLLADLTNEQDAQRRYAAYTALLRERSPALAAALLESLPESGVEGQNLGLSLLMSFGVEIGHPALRKLLDRKHPLLQLGAAAALFRTGDASVIDHIVQPLGRAEITPPVRVAMIQKLYGIQDARVLAALRGLLQPASGRSVVEAVLPHLLRAADPEARPKVRELLAAPTVDPKLKPLCSAFLLAVGDTEHVPLLVDALQADTGSELVRFEYFLTEAGRLPEAILTELRRIVEAAKMPYQAQNALRILANQGGSKDVPLFKKLVESSDPQLAKAALEALQRAGAPLPADSLRRLLASPQVTIAVAAAESLHRADDDSGLSRLLELAKTASTNRTEVVVALGRFRNRKVVEPLIELLNDREDSVRTVASNALDQVLESLFPYRRFDFASAGYQVQASPARRAEAVARIRAWWEAHRGK